MGINNKCGNWWQSGKILFFLYKGQQEEGMEGQESPKERGGNLVFTFSKERSGKVKGHSVDVISISLPLSPSISLAFSPLFLFLFPEIPPMGVE